MIQKYAPASVVANSDWEILQYRGATSLYFKKPSGDVRPNLLKLARGGLLHPLRSALRLAKKSGSPVRKRGLRVKFDRHTRDVNLSVIPVIGAATKERSFLVIFEPKLPASKLPKARTRPPGKESESQLRRELQSTRDYLQSVLERHRADNEGLQIANEELRCSNEELQIINEELENAQRELQTSNGLLANSNQEVLNINNDLVNLLSSIQMPIIMLDDDLRIRRFTPMAGRLFHVAAADIGRPLGDLKLEEDLPHLSELLTEAMDTLHYSEREVQDGAGRWYSLRVRPYKTRENRIEGVVMTMLDIDQLKRDKEKLSLLVELSFEPIIVWDFDKGVVEWNQGCERLYGFKRAEAVGCVIHELLQTVYPLPHDVFLARLVALGEWKGELRHTTKDGREVIVESRLQTAEIGGRRIVLETNRDITERTRRELHTQFINQLDFAMGQVADPDEIVRLATCRLGEYLGVNRCHLSEINRAADVSIVRESWEGWLHGATSLAGEYPIDDYATPELREELEAGQAAIINDVRTDPRTRAFASQYASLGVAAAMSTPALSERQWEATLTVAHSEPRNWNPDEAQLMRDITVRIWSAVKQARSIIALRESEARARRTLVEQMVAGVAECDATGRFATVNRRYCDITGYTEAELLQMRISDITHPDDWPYNAELYRRLFEAGESFFVEKRYRRKGDSEIWVNTHASPIRNAQGNIAESVSVVIDITGGKRAERELAAAKDRLAADLDAMTRLQEIGATFTREGGSPAFTDIVEAAITITHADKGIMQFFDSTKGMLSIVAHRGFDQPFLDFWNSKQSMEAWRPALERGARVIVEDLTVSPIFQGTPALDVQLQAGVRAVQSTPVIGRAGSLLGVLSTHYESPRRPDERALRLLDLLVRQTADIIERAQTEAELRSAYERAEAATRAKDEFLAVVSHELRSPLTAILGYVQLLHAKTADAATFKRIAEVIERNGKAQLQLIEDLLDTARIITGKLKLEVQPLDLGAVIGAAIDVVRPAALAKGIETRCSLDAHAGQITGDPDRLQQVVWNLLSNAIKFTPEGGLVEVTLERADPYIQIVVRDTGKGIDPEFLPYIFERFRQSDMSSTRRFGGLGLGLSLVQHLVELHGGSAHAESAGSGQGAVFTIRLPLRAVYTAPPPEHGPVGAKPRRATDSLAGVRVLIVDDEQDVRSLLALTLENYGAKAQAVSSGREALELLGRQTPDEHFDVLISDIGMPDEDGYTLIRNVRALPPDKGGAIPAIALTAYGRVEYRARALQAGFQTHTIKPVEPDTLVVAIRNLIQEYAAKEA